MSNLNARQFGQQPEHNIAPKGTDPSLHSLAQSHRKFQGQNKGRGPGNTMEHQMVVHDAHNMSGWW